jgi:hypothetical protein
MGFGAATLNQVATTFLDASPLPVFPVPHVIVVAESLPSASADI